MTGGCFYHIYNRGNNNSDVFFRGDNYSYFLEKVKKYLTPHVDILAYCLMPNHFHFLVYSKGDVDTKIFGKDLMVMLRSYSQAINKQEKRTGSLFHQHTKIKPLEEENSDTMALSHSIAPPETVDYPTTCFHYIHQNPLKAGIVKRMENYEWSSFRDYSESRKDSICNRELAFQLLEIPLDGKSFLTTSYKVEQQSQPSDDWESLDGRNRLLCFSGLLTETGWIMPAYVEIDTTGRIISIKNEVKKSPKKYESINGYALPGFQNAHSHAFQYAMAGLGEIHPPNQRADNFWTWRNKMYHIAQTIDPDQMEAIAAMLYSEMLRHGYTHVAEFHYLHHDKNGEPYTSIAEMGERLVAAAQKAGIKITLVPMFYQKGGFIQPPEDHQKRFISPTLDEYLKLLAASKKVVNQYEGASLGLGVHSLRAVHGDELIQTLKDGPKDLPFHIHIAEQLKEVDDCIAYCGKRPVEYLFDQVEVTERFHLVHATHLNDYEVKVVAESGAHVVLCPTTEGNLGDGLFRFRDYKASNGNWSIGTDSHIGIGPLEELRLLDYGQRLISHQRDTFVDSTGDSGRYGFSEALIGGRRAMGNTEETFFKVGQPFDAVVFDSRHPLLATSSPESLLSTIIYSGDTSMVLGSMTDGNWTSQGGLIDEDIQDDFVAALKELGIRS